MVVRRDTLRKLSSMGNIDSITFAALQPCKQVLLAGFLPFDEKVMNELFRKIQRAEFAYPPWLVFYHITCYQEHSAWFFTLIFVSPPHICSIRFSKESKFLLSKMLVTDPNIRISLEEVQKNAWFNKGFEASAPITYAPITVTKKQLASAVSTVKLIAAAGADAVGPPGAPTYVCFVHS